MNAGSVRVAVLNAGTATFKLAVLEVTGATPVELHRAEHDWTEAGTRADVVERAFAGIGARPDALGHRVVHGGRNFQRTVRIDRSVEEGIERLIPLAPLHNAPALESIRAAGAVFADVPAFAVFDTAFHAGRPPHSMRYALAEPLVESLDAYRYGFHGIAHAALVEDLAAAAGVPPEKADAITLQLGSGCSICAVRAGRSLETSMGYTPLEGLVMATRCGSIDPSLVVQMVRRGWSADDIESELNSRSGLLALAGDRDLRNVLAAEARGEPRARLAVEAFVHAIVLTVGGYLTLLGGAGAIVFGGGIGANSAEIRSRVAAGLAAWGVRLDEARNAGRAPGRISAAGSRPVYAFQTDEERVIAREVAALMGLGVGSVEAPTNNRG